MQQTLTLTYWAELLGISIILLMLSVLVIKPASAVSLPPPDCNGPFAPPSCDDEPSADPLELEGNLLGNFHSAGEITGIDTITGQSTLVDTGDMELPAGITATAHDAANGRTYLATGDGDDALYMIDHTTSEITKVGNFGRLATNIQAMDMAPITQNGFTAGILYGVSIDGFTIEETEMQCGPNCLFAILPQSGRTFPIASVNANQIRGISFDANGSLSAIDTGGNNTVYTIDGNGTMHLQFSIPVAQQGLKTGLQNSFSLAHSCDNTLYAVDTAYGILARIDATTEQAYWINDLQDISSSTGSINIQGLDGLACE